MYGEESADDVVDAWQTRERAHVQAGAIGNVTEVHAGCGIFRDTYCRSNRLAAATAKR